MPSDDRVDTETATKWRVERGNPQPKDCAHRTIVHSDYPGSPPDLCSICDVEMEFDIPSLTWRVRGEQ